MIFSFNYMNKIFSTAVVNLMLAIMSALTSIIVARFFGPELRGVYSVVTSLVNTSVSVAVFGTPTYIARTVAHEKRMSTSGFNIYRAIVTIIIVSSVAAYILATLMNWNSRLVALDLTMVILLASYIPFSIMSVVLLNLSLGQANWLAFNSGRLAFAFITILGVTFYYFLGGRQLYGIVASLVLANILAVVIQWIYSKPVPQAPGGWFVSLKRVYIGARYYALNSLSSVSTGYIDYLILSMLFDSAQIGFWAVARTLAALLSPINNALSVVVFSGFVRMETERFSGFRKILGNFVLFNAFSVIFFLVFSEPIINAVFGEKFGGSLPLVPMALASVVGASCAELFEERLRGAGHPGPVNISRFTPLVFLLGILVFKEYVTTVPIFATVFAIGQSIRLLLAIILLRLFRV